MRHYAGQGRVHQALRQFELCVRALRATVDTAPSAATVRLWAEANAVEAGAVDRAAAAERATDLLARLRALSAGRPARSDGFGREIATLAETGVAEMQRVAGAPDADAWAAVVDEWSTLGMPYPAAYARWRQAQALRFHGGDAARAAKLRRDALTAAGQLGASPLRAAIAGVILRAGTSAPRSGGLPELTPREGEVADLLTQGCTNREIADALGIAEGTASVHVSNLLRKLGVSSRTQAMALLLSNRRKDGD
jgi:DNA-binding CsgD family transcriptional regulator